jgi:putative SOS response-associated peptidase YedK
MAAVQSFGRVEITVPRARLDTAEGPTTEWNTAPNELCAALHNRDARGSEAGTLAAMARRTTGRRGAAQGDAGPLPSDAMICWPVSPRVGSVKNNDPGLVEPINLP